MSVQTTALSFRAALMRRDQAAADAMVRAYGAGWKAIKTELDKLIRAIEARQAAGEFINATVLMREAQLRSLLAQVEKEIGLFARLASRRVISEQREAIEAARRNALALFYDQLPSGIDITFSLLPKKALAELVGFMGDGSPLRDVFDTFGGQAEQIIRDELTAGMIAGRSLRSVAHRIRDQLGGQLSRALLISRTETLRAYREASIQNYKANDDVIKGWRWTASMSSRTCPMCLAMDGSEHPMSESFNSHPACRCVPVPITKSWRELGIGIDQPEKAWTTGAQWFDGLAAEQQRAILGGAAYRAYQAGQVKLSDFVGERRTLRWGRTRYTRSLTEILGDRAEQFKKAA